MNQQIVQQNLTLYRCDGYRSVYAESAQEAARIFANRQARRDYGRRGYCRTLRLDCWTEGGGTVHYEAFIGRDVTRNECSGHNIWLFVSRRKS